MPKTTRKARHKSEKHRDLTTAQAILAVVEEICAERGPMSIQLGEVAEQLGIETPAIYRHYKGTKGVIGAFAKVALNAEIDTFKGIENLSFEGALLTQAERMFDLYAMRPGIGRFLMADLSAPGGLSGFENEENLALARELFALEQDLHQRGLHSGALREMSFTAFLAARTGPSLFGFAFNELLSNRWTTDIDTLKQDFLETVKRLLVQKN